jgi:hypothetical protein
MRLEVKYGYRLGKSRGEAANSFGFAVFLTLDDLYREKSDLVNG